MSTHTQSGLSSISRMLESVRPEALMQEDELGDETDETEDPTPRRPMVVVISGVPR